MVDMILEATARVLVKHGYAGTNTNLVAEVAGISVGSLYQYFPNKDSLIAAVHQRHIRQMRDMMLDILSQAKKSTMEEAVSSLVKAMLEAHHIEPKLHHVLEVEFPFSDSKYYVDLTEQEFSHQFKKLLGKYRKRIKRQNLELATYVILGIVRSLVHQVVLEKNTNFSLSEIHASITEAILGYLTLSSNEK